VQTFHNGVTQLLRATIDVAARGTLMNKIEDEAYNLMEMIDLTSF